MPILLGRNALKLFHIKLVCTKNVDVEHQFKISSYENKTTNVDHCASGFINLNSKSISLCNETSISRVNESQRFPSDLLNVCVFCNEDELDEVDIG